MRPPLLCCVAFGLLAVATGFAPLPAQTLARTPFSVSKKHVLSRTLLVPDQVEQEPKKTLVERVWNRLDTLDAAGLKTESSPQYQIGFRGGLIMFVVAFGYKWYRARFINKISVWDRQPQWNTVVTNREQEKELKAYTCKNCGSTIFIARHRGWLFEGTFGLGGLGCYTCGAKGKDNFVMDRDRIVEDVGDEDDYFDYEQPLDFVSASERRKLLKETGGDEEKANQLLVDRAEASAATIDAEAEIVTDSIASDVAEETAEETTDEEETVEEAVANEETSVADETDVEEETEKEETTAEVVVDVEPEVIAEETTEAEEKPAPPPSPAPKISDDDLFDILDD